MTIKPLSDRVLIKPTPAEERTVSGIIIPDSAQEKPLRGTIIAVGPGSKDVEMTVKENDVVIYSKYSGSEIEIDGEKLILMRQNDILATVVE
jgi:chaperonin GroES